MTPAQFKAAREAIGHTQDSLAREWGTKIRRIGRWEQGTCPIDPIAAYCIQMMIDQHKGDTQ
jgi:DNA-binding transcriptional regulator YiaG